MRWPGELADIELGGLANREYLHELKDQEVIVIDAPLGALVELPIICGLRRAAYHGDECPTCRAEREEATRVIEDTLRQDREEQQRLSGMWISGGGARQGT